MLFAWIFGLVVGVLLLSRGDSNLDFFLAGANLMGAFCTFCVWMADRRNSAE